MTGIEPTLAGALRWAAARGYEHFTQVRLERSLRRAAENGVSVQDLCRTEVRFAHFVRMVRALEVCSNNEMADYLVDLMVGGVESRFSDDSPDQFQLLMDCLGSLTRTEIIVLAEMRKLRLFDDERSGEDESKRNELELFGENSLGFSRDYLASLLNRMAGSGLVTSPGATYGGGYARNSNRLSPLARELFHYLDYSHRITN
ncbi:hypothetical protein [Salinicola avicenniae]|uniref:hypothetical protein n=1 Tax=Salinicola avicenniae TaxID=2916836 RepID=UPI002072F990|nr:MULTISPECIES: hypothetical protein [unclassified Salinicola]